MTRFIACFAAAILAVSIVGCGGGPPRKVRFDGKSFERGVIAHEGTHQSFLYTIPAQGLAQNERLGIITSSSETPEQLQSWIIKMYTAAMNAAVDDNEGKRGFLEARVLEETPTSTTACKVGRYGARSFIGVHVCGTANKQAGCLELDEQLDDPLGTCTASDTACVRAHAATLCKESRARHEAELIGLLPVILIKL